MKKNDRVEILWYDIEHDPSWQDDDKIKPPELFKAIGYYTKKDKKFIYICSMIGGNQRDVIKMPRGCIEKITVI